MEITFINRIIEFETNMKALHNPSFASQLLSVSNTFIKWSALILALIASFTTINNRLKILIIRLQRHTSPAFQSQQQNIIDDDYDSETASSCSFSDNESEDDENYEDEDETATSSFRVHENFGDIDEQWRNCNMGLRQRRRRSIGDLFSWSEFTAAKSVVKLWDNLGLGLGFDDDENEYDVVRGSDSGNLFAIYDMNSESQIGKMESVFCAKGGISRATLSLSSPMVTLDAEADGGGHVVLRGWDARIGSQIPAMIAEWRPKLGNLVGVLTGGLDKVNVRDEVSSTLTVGDLRKVNSPLEDLRRWTRGGTLTTLL